MRMSDGSSDGCASDLINLGAYSLERAALKEGDEILIAGMEHHSNIVPWQMLCEQTGAQLRVVPVTDSGELDMDQYRALLGPRTKLVGVAHVSNALGTINPDRKSTRLNSSH